MSDLKHYPKKRSPVLGTVYYFDCECAVVVRRRGAGIANRSTGRDMWPSFKLSHKSEH